VNKNAFCYSVLLSESADATLAVGVVSSFVFMVEWLSLIVHLYVENKVRKIKQWMKYWQFWGAYFGNS